MINDIEDKVIDEIRDEVEKVLSKRSRSPETITREDIVEEVEKVLSKRSLPHSGSRSRPLSHSGSKSPIRSKSPVRSESKPPVQSEPKDIKQYSIFRNGQEYIVNTTSPSGLLALLLVHKFADGYFSLDEDMNTSLKSFRKKGKYHLKLSDLYFDDDGDFGRVVNALVEKFNIDIEDFFESIKLSDNALVRRIQKTNVKHFINTVSDVKNNYIVPSNNLMIEEKEEGLLYKIVTKDVSIRNGALYGALCNSQVVSVATEGGFYNLKDKSNIVSVGAQALDENYNLEDPKFYDANNNPFFDDQGGFFAGLMKYRDTFDIETTLNFDDKLVDPIVLDDKDVIVTKYYPENFLFVYHVAHGYIGEFYSKSQDYLNGVRAALYAFNTAANTITDKNKKPNRRFRITDFQGLKEGKWSRPSEPETKGPHKITYAKIKSVEVESFSVKVKNVGLFMNGARDLYLFLIEPAFSRAPVDIFNNFTSKFWQTSEDFDWVNPKFTRNYYKKDDTENYDLPEYLPWELNQTLQVLVYSNKVGSTNSNRDILRYSLKDNVDYVNGLIFFFNSANSMIKKNDKIEIRRVGVVNLIRQSYDKDPSSRKFVVSSNEDNYPDGYTLMYPPYAQVDPKYFITKTHTFAENVPKTTDKDPDSKKYRTASRTITYLVKDKAEFIRGAKVAAVFILNSVKNGEDPTDKQIENAQNQIKKAYEDKNVFRPFSEYEKEDDE